MHQDKQGKGMKLPWMALDSSLPGVQEMKIILNMFTAFDFYSFFSNRKLF